MKKSWRALSFLLCMLLVFPVFAACSKGLDFHSDDLPIGKVGEEYFASVAMEGAQADTAEISYTLKEGSTLPAGLYLDNDGFIMGTPAAKAENHKFTVVASAEKYKDAEADFQLTIATGALSYTGGSLRAAVGRETSLNVATATGAGSAVTYTIEGSLPAGLELNTNGTITGTPTTLGENTTFKVTAAANDCTPGVAEFTVEVVLPWLVYNNAALSAGRVGEFYSEQLPAPVEADGEAVTAALTYVVKSGSALPAGLTLDTDGFLYGTPTVEEQSASFTVEASATGYTAGEATFTMRIRAAVGGGDEQGTVTFVINDQDSTKFTGYVGETLTLTRATALATSSNNASVTYALSQGSTLPAGFELLANGTLRCSKAFAGTAGDYTFKVTASAANCVADEQEFTLTILPEKLIYGSKTIDSGTVGDSYSATVAWAEAPGGAAVSVKYALAAGSSMPQGLSLAADGTVSGTPQKSFKLAYFTVEASADQFSSRTAEVYIHIRDAVTTVTDGVFEAEYMDLTGITGGGYSGSAQEDGMVQAGPALGASNGYYVGFTHGELVLTYNITASAAVTNATLVLRLASEIGTLVLTPANFGIAVGGTEIPYGSVTVNGATGTMSMFQDITVTTSLNLAAGDNIITIEVKSNLLMGGTRTGGPAIDCLKITNTGSATLSWRPCQYNLNRFD